MLSDQKIKAIVDTAYETGFIPTDDALRLMNHLVFVETECQLCGAALEAALGDQAHALAGEYYVYKAAEGGVGVFKAEDAPLATENRIITRLPARVKGDPG